MNGGHGSGVDLGQTVLSASGEGCVLREHRFGAFVDSRIAK